MSYQNCISKCYYTFLYQKCISKFYVSEQLHVQVRSCSCSVRCCGVLLCSMTPSRWHLAAETCSTLKNCYELYFIKYFCWWMYRSSVCVTRNDVLPFRQGNAFLTNSFNQQLIVNYKMARDAGSVNTRQTFVGCRQRWYDPDHVMLSNIERG